MLQPELGALGHPSFAARSRYGCVCFGQYSSSTERPSGSPLANNSTGMPTMPTRCRHRDDRQMVLSAICRHCRYGFLERTVKERVAISVLQLSFPLHILFHMEIHADMPTKNLNSLRHNGFRRFFHADTSGAGVPTCRQPGSWAHFVLARESGPDVSDLNVRPGQNNFAD